MTQYSEAPYMTRQQFTANCNQLHALINSKTQTPRTRELIRHCTTAANLAIARMRLYYSANPTSSVALDIAKAAASMQAELDAAATRTTPATATNATSESGQAGLLFLILIVAALVMLYMAGSAAARLAGYTDIVELLSTITNFMP